jgi:predicted DNA-binding mobile mystery protein A
MAQKTSHKGFFTICWHIVREKYNSWIICYVVLYNIYVISNANINNIRVIDMLPKHRRIMRNQLDTTFEQLSKLRILQPPVKGWLRSIREALGMSGKQLGERLGVSQPRVVKMEKDELTGALTLKSIRQAAEAMDCVFVYAVVPRTSLDETIRQQAIKVAGKSLSRTSHTMLLEDQMVSINEQQKMLKDKVEDLIRDIPRDFWSNKS